MVDSSELAIIIVSVVLALLIKDLLGARLLKRKKAVEKTPSQPTAEPIAETEADAPEELCCSIT